ncbi:MAG: hypothetical protein ACJ71S_00485 [Acidobacteriaceae bacterium]
MDAQVEVERAMLSRRDFLQWTSVALSVRSLSGTDWLLNDTQRASKRSSMVFSEHYPAYPAELIQQIVTVAHFDLNKLKDLLAPRPHLVKAAWDWGFGDWETPLGAACHMGRRDIAEFLLTQGATPSLFSFVLLGDVDRARQIVESQPGIQRIAGPHSISLLAHARMGGSRSEDVLAYLRSIGDADMVQPAPMTERERSSLCGGYHFENEPALHVDVSDDVRSYAGSPMYTYPPQLNWTRTGTMGRPLFHLGGNVFYPAGASSIRIQFSKEAHAMKMTIIDGPETLIASRA